MSGLVRLFLTQADARPHADAIIPPFGAPASFSDLATGSARRAAAFARAGLCAGDRVLIGRGLSPTLYETLIAIWRCGATAVFPEPAAGLPGIVHAVQMAHPTWVAAGPLLAMVRPFIEDTARLKALPEPDQAERVQRDWMPGGEGGGAPALITFTSGSTGRPKGIARSANFLILQHTLIEAFRRTEPGDIDLISLPVFVLSNLAAGATSVVPRGPLRRPAALHPETLARQISRHGVTRVVAPPAVCARLGDVKAVPQISRIFTGGGPVFPNLLRRLQELTPHGECYAVYGSTEAEPIAHVAASEIRSADWAAMAAGAGLLAGRPIPEATVAIVGGEVQVSGPHVNLGYLDPKDDARTKVSRDGRLWHRTGDAARMDDNGRLWLLGRVDASGAGLMPFAVETAAMSWPGVKQAAFLGRDEGGLLALAGDAVHLPLWRERASALGNISVHLVHSVPMDARHNSKVDYGRLRILLQR